MSLPITLRQLEIFVAVARHGRVIGAAGMLHLTQSATSMAIAQLERQLDTALFERRGRELVLTERGRLLLAEAPELLARVRALPELLGGRSTGLRGELRIAASTTIGRYLLAPALAAFGIANPEVSVQLTIGNSESALSALDTHRADVAYVEGSVARAGMLAETWRTDALVLVGAAAHWKRRETSLRRTELATLPWIMREPGSGTREVLEAALHAAGLEMPKALMTFDDSEAILQVVASGIGVACLSTLVVEALLSPGKLIVLKTPFLKLERRFWRVTRSGSRTGPIDRAFQISINPEAAAGGTD